MHLEFGHRSWVVAYSLCSYAIEVAERLGRGDSGLEPANHVVAPIRRCSYRCVMRSKARGNPQFGAVQVTGKKWKFEALRHHADYYVGPAVQQKFLTENTWISMEAIQPRGVAYHRNR